MYMYNYQHMLKCRSQASKLKMYCNVITKQITMCVCGCNYYSQLINKFSSSSHSHMRQGFVNLGQLWGSFCLSSIFRLFSTLGSCIKQHFRWLPSPSFKSKFLGIVQLFHKCHKPEGFWLQWKWAHLKVWPKWSRFDSYCVRGLSVKQRWSFHKFLAQGCYAVLLYNPINLVKCWEMFLDEVVLKHCIQHSVALLNHTKWTMCRKLLNAWDWYR